MIKFEIAKLLHKHKNSRLPINFENYFTLVNSRHSCRTRTSVNNQLNIPFFKMLKMQRSIKFVGAKIWNLIPDKSDHIHFKYLKNNIIKF